MAKIEKKTEKPQSGRIRILTDDNGHNYAVPIEKCDRFNELLNLLGDDENRPRNSAALWREWAEVFQPLELGYHLTCYSFADLRLDKK